MAGLRSISGIVELLRELLAELLELDVDEIAIDADLEDRLTVDSLQRLELMALVERRLHMAFELDGWVAPRTVTQLATYIWSEQERGRDS
jgi:acyl carrier protein